MLNIIHEEKKCRSLRLVNKCFLITYAKHNIEKWNRKLLTDRVFSPLSLHLTLLNVLHKFYYSCLIFTRLLFEV